MQRIARSIPNAKTAGLIMTVDYGAMDAVKERNQRMKGQLSILDWMPEADPNYKPSICRFSNHECNKKELWKIAGTLNLDLPCPHVCCRLCADTMCGARCNGSSRPQPKIRQWHRVSKQLPEKSGMYEVMDINGTRAEAWFELTIKGFNHVTNYQIEAWREKA